MEVDRTYDELAADYPGSSKSYATGLLSCLALTGASFATVSYELVSPEVAPYLLGALALVQAVVQLLFFLHLGKESEPKWNLMMFWSMLTTLIIIVAGSLWVMYDLNHRTMPAELMEEMHAH